MNYEQYHQKGGFYAIPVEIFDGLCEEKDELQKENQQLKEEKRLILKDISFWIRNSKVEQIEGDMVHQRYWMCFEDIVNKIFKKYNTENLSDEDLKYNHYLEKENKELIRQLQQKEDIIYKILDLLKEIK